jgi:hypothetical protein
VRIILERSAAFTHRKKATTSQTQGVALFERYDLTSLMNRFDDTNHLGGGELALEHSLDRLTALDWLLRHLMVDSIRVIKLGQTGRIGSVEALQPTFDCSAWSHIPKFQFLFALMAGRPPCSLRAAK